MLFLAGSRKTWRYGPEKLKSDIPLEGPLSPAKDLPRRTLRLNLPHART